MYLVGVWLFSSGLISPCIDLFSYSQKINYEMLYWKNKKKIKKKKEREEVALQVKVVKLSLHKNLVPCIE